MSTESFTSPPPVDSGPERLFDEVAREIAEASCDAMFLDVILRRLRLRSMHCAIT